MYEIVVTIFLVKATMTFVLPQSYSSSDCDKAAKYVAEHIKITKKVKNGETQCRIRDWRKV